MRHCGVLLAFLLLANLVCAPAAMAKSPDDPDWTEADDIREASHNGTVTLYEVADVYRDIVLQSGQPEYGIYLAFQGEQTAWFNSHQKDIQLLFPAENSLREYGSVVYLCYAVFYQEAAEARLADARALAEVRNAPPDAEACAQLAQADKARERAVARLRAYGSWNRRFSRALAASEKAWATARTARKEAWSKARTNWDENWTCAAALPMVRARTVFLEQWFSSPQPGEMCGGSIFELEDGPPRKSAAKTPRK